ncbi:MAG: hypothetical protein AB2672_11000 [Candidatus Thiodiazotropha endolucinida]
MHNKKVLILIFAFLMSPAQALWAEGIEGGAAEGNTNEALPVTQDEQAVETESVAVDRTESAAVTEASVNTVEPAEATEAVETTDAIAAEASSETATDLSKTDFTRDSMRDHWKAREEQYQALRKRAEEAGVMLPESPPWRSEMGQMMRPDMEERMAHRKKMMSMSEEERDSLRRQHYQEMRSRAEEAGIEMPETPPWVARQQAMDEEWAKHQKVIEGMSDEERAACHAMHRRHMGMMRGGRAGTGCGGMGHQGCGMHKGDYAPRMMPGYGPGYGYGPGPVPYGPQNFWDPNQ